MNSPGYASLRMTDVLEKTVELSTKIEGVSRTDFYVKLMEKFENRRIMSDQKSREVFLNELTVMFIEEWRKNKRT